MKLQHKVWLLLIVIGAAIVIIAVVPKKKGEEVKSNSTGIVTEKKVAVSAFQYSSDAITSLGLANEAKDILSDMADSTNSVTYICPQWTH